MKEIIIELYDFKLILFFIVFGFIGFWKSAQDTVAYHYYQSVFNNKWFNPQFFNAELSWVNKYKSLTKDGKSIVDKQAKFFLSKSLFVIVTDAFHLFYFFQSLCYVSVVAIGFYLGSTHSYSISTMLLYTAIGQCCNKLVFMLTFNFLFIKSFYKI